MNVDGEAGTICVRSDVDVWRWGFRFEGPGDEWESPDAGEADWHSKTNSDWSWSIGCSVEDFVVMRSLDSAEVVSDWQSASDDFLEMDWHVADFAELDSAREGYGVSGYLFDAFGHPPECTVSVRSRRRSPLIPDRDSD